jgi:acyl-CoA-binding protein
MPVKLRLIKEIKGKPLLESVVQAMIVKEAALKSCILWRNNVGCLIDKMGRPIRYGLNNVSKKANDEYKSSDLIGIRKVTITPDMVGKKIGVFVAREVKREGWKYKGTEAEEAQKRYIDLVNEMGGDACFANDVGTI